MLNSEYKVLKYISRHENCTYQNLKTKFRKKDIDQILPYINEYIDGDAMKEQMVDGIYNSVFKYDSDAKFRLSRSGEELIERKRHEFWAFFFPYAITTLIALSSVVAQIIEILLDVAPGN